jgi:hypothetical protein
MALHKSRCEHYLISIWLLQFACVLVICGMVLFEFAVGGEGFGLA